MGNLVFTQGLPIFYAIYDAFFHATFPTSNGLYTTFPTSKIVVNFRQTATYCGLFPQKSDPTDLGIRTIGKEKPRKAEVFRGFDNKISAWRTGERDGRPSDRIHLTLIQKDQYSCGFSGFPLSVNP